MLCLPLSKIFGSLIYVQLIPHAVDFFTGKALEYEAMDDDDDDDDVDLDDDDDASDEGVSSHISFLAATTDSVNLCYYPRRTRTQTMIYQHVGVDHQNVLMHLHQLVQMSIRKNANNSERRSWFLVAYHRLAALPYKVGLTLHMRVSILFLSQ